ncbi:putative tyrosinase 2 [Diaporthe ampelina]|uniref:Putative tyrosinase 2 n=1 Tax=Diaporthe ampelina TaxID=1214573 RepID=A0A0G2FLP9_9PEZI|nr:putative tyrosinase 2 [Diaporthe ampelina]
MWARGGPSWDLYVLALLELQGVDEADVLSYFQIMGIHGLPFQRWSDVGQVPGGANQAGFCPHNQLLFGLWHRPFISLYEQTLVSHAIQISQRYTGDKAPEYRAAAESLRVAYWDWAANSSLPDIITHERINVNGPSGPVTVKNPLHSYWFQNYPFTIQYMNGGPLSKQSRSTRCPNKDIVDDVAQVNAGLASSAFKAQVMCDKYNTFTTVTSFENMETDRYTSTSFESPHNNVHNSVGCSNGTMYDLNWSAFDPAFMLHHTNVDRLIALWQAIYPNSSIFSVVDYAGALYGTPAGNVSADTPLKPFHDRPGDGDGVDGFHTSRSVRDVAVLGYTYPELQASGGNDNTTVALSPDELAEHVRFKVNSLYSSVPTVAENATAARLARRLVHHGSSSSSSSSSPGRFKGKRAKSPLRGPVATRKTWSVAISVDRAEVPLPATIGCYLGDDGGGGGRREQAGRMSLLSIPAMGVTHSTIPLDKALGAVGVVDLADADEVASYLNRTLKFEMLEGDGTAIENLESIPGLQFIVQDRDYIPRESDVDFPTYGAANTRKWGKSHGRWSLSG